MVNKIKDVSVVSKHNFCTGCGTCVSMCQNEAIELVIDKKKGIFIPKLNREKCINCGICYKVCPGHEVNFKMLNQELFGKQPRNIFMQNFIDCYIGYSTDHNIRYNSSSGGLITQLLIFALEEGMINGALVTRMKKNNTLEPEPFIAKTKEEIIEASKSKYCPVPLNIVLKEILYSKEEKFAVVGLPCHIQGIRKAEKIDSKLKEKIVFHLGIVCNHTPTFLATEFLLKKLKVKKENLAKLEYRGNGWPSGIKIATKNGTKLFIPHFSSDYWGGVFNKYFIPARCSLCNDKICGLSNASFADAWIPELLRDDNVGTSIVISRTKIFDEFLKKAVMKHKIRLNEVNEDVVLQSQSLYIVRKKLEARIKLFMLFRKKIPDFYENSSKLNTSDYIDSVFFYLRNYISSYRYFWNLIIVHQNFIKKLKYYKSKLFNKRGL